MFPESLSDALSVSVDTGAGEDFFWRMVEANIATVDWTSGKINTEEYLEKIEYYLEEPEPIDFVNETLSLYLPQVELL